MRHSINGRLEALEAAVQPSLGEQLAPELAALNEDLRRASQEEVIEWIERELEDIPPYDSDVYWLFAGWLNFLTGPPKQVAIAREAWQWEDWDGRGLPPQLTPGHTLYFGNYDESD